ncbi:hypothetical protein INR49_007703 [Caranx melampygus]|nr:hypothetical protein INR49_007703 [Caranx melampygus]
MGEKSVFGASLYEVKECDCGTEENWPDTQSRVHTVTYKWLSLNLSTVSCTDFASGAQGGWWRSPGDFAAHQTN